jgi:hypothetical protein
MRLSQAQFAEAIRAAGNAMGAPNRCTKRLVQKWETGEHAACRPDYLRVLQAVTGLSARELGFRILPDDSGESLDVEVEPLADAVVPDEAEAGIRARAAAAFAMSGITAYTSDTTIEGSMDRLRQALEHPSHVDSRTAEFVETATERLFDLEHHSPARLLAPTVDRHLATVTSLLTAARHEVVRRRMMVSAGRAVALAGWLAFDRGDIPSAHRCWDTSISAAEGTGDGALLAASLTWLSFAAVRRGDPSTAWQLAHTASRQTPADPRATAWAMCRVALYAAGLGEQGAAYAALERSLELAGHLPGPRPGDGTEPWLRSFDHAALYSSAARTASLLKDPRAAGFAAQAVESLGPARVKARAIVLAEAALTAARVGELELCLDHGSAAALLTREMDVSTAADVLYEVLPLVLPFSDTRAIRELLPHLNRLRRTVDVEDEGDPWASVEPPQ